MHTAATTHTDMPFEGICAVTGQTLPAGSPAIHVEGLGCVHPDHVPDPLPMVATPVPQAATPKAPTPKATVTHPLAIETPFDGVCPECRGDLPEGALALYVPGKGAIHTGCATEEEVYDLGRGARVSNPGTIVEVPAEIMGDKARMGAYTRGWRDAALADAPC